MTTPHNGIIIGNTVYNTILSLKLSYLHVLAHFIMWYTCTSHIFYKVLQVACTVCICECVFQMHHWWFVQEGRFGQTHEIWQLHQGNCIKTFKFRGFTRYPSLGQTIDWYIIMILMKIICTYLSHCSSDISRAKLITLAKLCPDRILAIGR